MTVKDSQSVTIEVYEGERIRTSDNNLLGLFDLPLPRASQRFPIKVWFAIDADIVLNVSAEEE